MAATGSGSGSWWTKCSSMAVSLGTAPKSRSRGPGSSDPACGTGGAARIPVGGPGRPTRRSGGGRFRRSWRCRRWSWLAPFVGASRQCSSCGTVLADDLEPAWFFGMLGFSDEPELLANLPVEVDQPPCLGARHQGMAADVPGGRPCLQQLADKCLVPPQTVQAFAAALE